VLSRVQSSTGGIIVSCQVAICAVLSYWLNCCEGLVNKRTHFEWAQNPQNICHYHEWRYIQNTSLAEYVFNHVPLSLCALLTGYQHSSAYLNGGTFMKNTKNTRHSLLNHKRSHTKLLQFIKTTY
jgi:hypothetical protein